MCPVGFRLEFDAVNKIFLVAFEGKITERTMDDCAATIRKIKPDPLFTLIDYTGVTQADLSTEHVQSAGRGSPPTRITRVIIAPQDLLFGLSRMFQIVGDLTWFNLHVVHTMEEALDIIGVKSPSFSPIRIDLPMTGPEH